MKRLATTALLAGLLIVSALASPETAPAEETVVDRQVSQVTGAELALEMVAGVRGVEVDATGATVHVESGGVVRPVRLDLSGAIGATSGDGEGGAVRYGVYLLAFGILVKVIRVLSRLGARRESRTGA